MPSWWGRLYTPTNQFWIFCTSGTCLQAEKATYGLNQALRTWYIELEYYLVTLEFIKSRSGSSLFILHNFEFIIYVLEYVDDIIDMGN